MSFDATERATFWGIVVGMTVSWISYLGVTQGAVQRFLAVPTITAAKRYDNHKIKAGKVTKISFTIG